MRHMTIEAIEGRLRTSLERDRARRSRCQLDGDTTIVQISGVSVGLALAVEIQTRETFEQIMERVGG